ncbi:class I SAM-dependent methyltransferase [Mycobacterium intracellulare]|uniref:class I SAM-dependent methyltransferase n=1 Tax=Mycobacterium intracellulare TaxID=1767 RepID=UPI000D52A396|nr:class I SAM-dependent methyltransferase [Mycobacterium intracellulare]
MSLNDAVLRANAAVSRRMAAHAAVGKDAPYQVRASRFILRLCFSGSGDCNICGSRIRFRGITQGRDRTLASHGFPYLLDDLETPTRSLCPVCGSADRDRLYKLYIDRFLPHDGMDRVLDIAPSAPLSVYLRSRAPRQYRTADLMMSGVDDVVDITDMPIYADNSFDFFICSHVLEHVPDDVRAVRELYRILAPGGRGIIMTPVAPEGSFDEDPSITDEGERWRRFGQGDHVRLYDRSTLCSRIGKGGFEVSALDSHTLGDETFVRHAISPGSVLYVVHKPEVDTV